ncbi:MAG: transposase [Cyanobacteriota bacterium]|nr:transposase [Cyanobacteriota bacterium]
MLHEAIQVRLYPTQNQQIQLAPTLGSARWWSNYGLNKSIEVYKESGKKIGCSGLNTLSPALKKSDGSVWLVECYRQVLAATTLKFTLAYKIFLDKRAGFSKFKYQEKQPPVQYHQNVKIVEGYVKFIRNIGAKPKTPRLIEGKIQTVIISKNYSGKSLASILTEIEGENQKTKEGRIYGLDLGWKHLAVTEDKKKSKYDNAKHLTKHEKSLKRKQQKLTDQQKRNKERYKYRKIVAKVYERVKNLRQDFLHKLSYKWVSDRLAVLVEKLHVLGMVRHQNFAKAISEAGWETFTNFLAYKLERKGGNLVEIERYFPRSKLCSNCFDQMTEMPLDVREWTCPHCATDRDRDLEGNAAINMRAEGMRILKGEGSAVSALGCEVRPKLGRKSKLRHSPISTEAPTIFGTPI